MALTPFEVVVLMNHVLWGTDYRDGRVRGKDMARVLEGLVSRDLMVLRPDWQVGQSRYALTERGLVVTRLICEVEGRRGLSPELPRAGVRLIGGIMEVEGGSG